MPLSRFPRKIFHFLAPHLPSSCFFNLSRVAPLPPLSALNGGCMQDVRPQAQVNTSKYYALCTKHYAPMHYTGCQVMSTNEYVSSLHKAKTKYLGGQSLTWYIVCCSLSNWKSVWCVNLIWHILGFRMQSFRGHIFSPTLIFIGPKSDHCCLALSLTPAVSPLK